MPEGLIFRQSGNVVDISTNGCIVFPEDDNGLLCESPEQSSPTGIHLLTTTKIIENQSSGIIIDDPQFSELLSQNNLNSKVCIINAPAENQALTINLAMSQLIVEIALFSQELIKNRKLV
ncbi:MAG: hypothetical protein RQ714_03290 [Nitrosomonas sp.]|nr:hypothetical protein [Nitrosomonas sp.]